MLIVDAVIIYWLYLGIVSLLITYTPFALAQPKSMNMDGRLAESTWHEHLHNFYTKNPPSPQKTPKFNMSVIFNETCIRKELLPKYTTCISQAPNLLWFVSCISLWWISASELPGRCHKLYDYFNILSLELLKSQLYCDWCSGLSNANYSNQYWIGHQQILCANWISFT